MKRIYGLKMGTVCLLIFTLVFPLYYVNAEENDVTSNVVNLVRSAYVKSADCELHIASGTATVNSYVEGKAGVSSISISVYLERYYCGSWQLYNSWSHSGGSLVIESDSSSVVSGTYRVWMAVSVTGSSGSESFNVYGNTSGC